METIFRLCFENFLMREALEFIAAGYHDAVNLGCRPDCPIGGPRAERGQHCLTCWHNEAQRAAVDALKTMRETEIP